MSVGKRKTDSAFRRSPESHQTTRRTTSAEWKQWLQKVSVFSGGLSNERGENDIRPFIDITLYGARFQALLDTGAVVNLVNSRVAKHLAQNENQPETSDTELRMVDGTCCSIVQKYVIPSTILGENYTMEAYLVPSLTTDAILGMRCIEELNLIQIDTQRETRGATKGIADCALASIEPLSATEEIRLQAFLDKELPKFDAVAGKTALLEHEIRLKNDTVPIKQRHYPRNPAMQAIINEEVASMLHDDVIEPSSSPWSSPVVLIKKATGKYRFCIDMRRVNDSSIKDAYPLPKINAILEKLRQAKYISTLDLKQGYWQVPLAEASRPITAFTVPGLGLFQFKVMPFGLHSAGATFQRLLDRVIGPELEPKAFAYLDDLVVVSSSFEEHLTLLGIVFERLRAAGLRLNPEKCHFARRELKYLGHVVNSRGISTDPEKVRAIREFPTPHNVRSLRSFLGLASWYRRFVEGFATVSAPLRTLLKKNANWSWGEIHQAAFDKLKYSLSTTPVLSCPDFSRTFTLQVDASNTGLGAALTQSHGDQEVVIAYASRLLSEPEQNYTTTEKECLALVWATKKFKPYLEGYHFTAVTDHIALKWLLKLHEPSGRLARWVMELQQYDFDIKYRKGTLNRVADALSRQPIRDVTSAGPSNLTTEEVTTPSLITPCCSAEPRINGAIAKQTQGETQREGEASPTWYEQVFNLVMRQPNRCPNYQVWSDRLYRSTKDKRSKRKAWKVCVSGDQIRQILEQNHDNPTAGHLGIKKTLARVGAEYYWPKWRKDVKNYVRSCAKCQKYKVPQLKPAGKMYFRRPRGPWYMVSIDLVGPLPRSQRGHRFLIVIQDTFSKWIELSPIGAATAKNVVSRMKDILLRCGAPDVLISDNGTQFTSKLFRELAEDWQITFQTTAPFSPQSNPVERPNRVVKTMIAQFIKTRHTTWDNHLNEFQFALNTAVHDSTGFTPAMLCLGRELKAPGAIHGPSVEVSSGTEEPTLQEVHRKRLAEFRRIYEHTHLNLRAAYERQARPYNLRRREVTFRVNDKVLRRMHTLSSAADAIVSKLTPKFDGPCTITGRRGENLYEVRDDESETQHVVHVKDLKPFITRT